MRATTVEKKIERVNQRSRNLIMKEKTRDREAMDGDKTEETRDGQKRNKR